ncbi:MAG: hypothetical protein AAFV98_00620 [Chloroflexota bacterium]
MGLNARLPGHDPIFISSWKGFRSFTDAIDQLGKDRFPVLVNQLPDGDEGYSTAVQAATMLEELNLFIAEQTNVQQAVLVDSERKHDISMGSNVLGGALTTDRLSGYDLGFDEQGFFVRDRWELNRILFRAMRVEQRLITPEEHRVEYHDRDSDLSFLCTTPFGKVTTGKDGIPRMLLREFHVEIRDTAPDRFAYITSPLSRILEAAIEANSEIEWI